MRLIKYTSDQPQVLVNLLMDADDRQSASVGPRPTRRKSHFQCGWSDRIPAVALALYFTEKKTFGILTPSQFPFSYRGLAPRKFTPMLGVHHEDELPSAVSHMASQSRQPPDLGFFMSQQQEPSVSMNPYEAPVDSTAMSVSPPEFGCIVAFSTTFTVTPSMLLSSMSQFFFAVALDWRWLGCMLVLAYGMLCLLVNFPTIAAIAFAIATLMAAMWVKAYFQYRNMALAQVQLLDNMQVTIELS